MKKTGINYAQEEIRKALVQEYLRTHPGVREQDVVLACKEGKLVFTQISEVLADVELRKQSGTVLLQANRMFTELAVHHDERWQECVQSTHHCLQIIDCLHSSNFGYYTEMDRKHSQNSILRLEGICATKTVHLNDATQKLAGLNNPPKKANSLRAKSLVIDYLVLVIEQLKALLAVFRQEIKLSDLFLEQSRKYMEGHYDGRFDNAISFSIQETQKNWQEASGNQLNRRYSLDAAYNLNEQILIETKNALMEAVQEIKTKLIQQRERIHKIWSAISSIEETVIDIQGDQPPQKQAKEIAPQLVKEAKSKKKDVVHMSKDDKTRYRFKR